MNEALQVEPAGRKDENQALTVVSGKRNCGWGQGDVVFTLYSFLLLISFLSCVHITFF